ncbi:SDR family NAD(P)-dependent oxidoreductase [Myxococcota bacterium]|nr:SDR family NAD(P)-dependent oxidoreductase [Myxococcota bacterium]
MKDLREKVGVVTGAASGIGLALVETMLGAGMKVVMADVEEASLTAESDRLAGQGGAVEPVHCDVRDPVSVEALATATLTRFGGVHVVCNNAGVAPAGPMLETTPADWKWITEVNVLGVAYGVTTFGPLLVEAGEGHIVNTASEAGLVTNSVLGMYCATKHAVLGLSESLYRELEPQGVGVSVLCPSLVRTKIFHSERNRDESVDPTAAQTSTIGSLREALSSMGIPPMQVAGDVLTAIREQRFWILTHGMTGVAASKRFEDLQANRNPSDPYEGASVEL